MAVKQAPSKKPAKAAGKSASKAPKASQPAGVNVVSAENKKTAAVAGWLQDASIEVPVPAEMTDYTEGQRELEFSVGMRQQEIGDQLRSELRGRALVHADGAVLALVEASYVMVTPKGLQPLELAQQMYAQLKLKLESLLAMAGHTPPLPDNIQSVQ